MLLEGKKLLITGVLTRESIAYAAATASQDHGAEIVLTSFGRAMTLTEKIAKLEGLLGEFPGSYPSIEWLQSLAGLHEAAGQKDLRDRRLLEIAH